MREDKISGCGSMKAGHDLVAAGYIALRGTSVIASVREKELRERFAAQFVRRCQNLYESRGLLKLPGISAFRDAESLVRRLKASSFCIPGEGGIMAALWDYFDSFGLGFEIDLRKIPILQETIEVCEVFDINPYRLRSEGCLLLTAENGGDLALSLEKEGIYAAVLGKVTGRIGRELTNGESRTFLDRPKPDELYKIQLTGGKV